jgi:hypothetical protein
MNVHSATCGCSVELYKLRYTLADFLPYCNFHGVFSKYNYFAVRIREAAVDGGHCIFRVPRSSFRVRHSSVGCSATQKGAAELRRAQLSSKKCSLSLRAQLSSDRVQRTSEGCNIAQKDAA